MATLQEAIDQIQDVIGALSYIRAAPDEPPDQLSVFPFAVCYSDSGYYHTGPAGLMTGLHNINLELHVARKDLPHDVQSAMAFAKSIPNAIFAANEDRTSLSAIETLGNISYTFGAMEWGGTATIGFRFTLEDVKTQDAVT